jgi:hypothetical protein
LARTSLVSLGSDSHCSTWVWKRCFLCVGDGDKGVRRKDGHKKQLSGVSESDRSTGDSFCRDQPYMQHSSGAHQRDWAGLQQLTNVGEVGAVRAWGMTATAAHAWGLDVQLPAGGGQDDHHKDTVWQLSSATTWGLSR